MSLLDVKRLSVRYDEKKIVDDASFAFPGAGFGLLTSQKYRRQKDA